MQVKGYKPTTLPPEGWYKLNSDGASCGNPGKAGGGGLIRDCSGNWFKGFARSIGFAIRVTAEFWALRDGLKLALSEGIQNLIVELMREWWLILLILRRTLINHTLLSCATAGAC